MNPDVGTFLETERDALAPYAALLELSDEQIERPTAADSPAHGWSGRDLLGHILAWLEHGRDVARELATAEQSPSRAAMDARWAAGGDAVNDELLAEWGALPIGELRRRFRESPKELRRLAAALPEARWADGDSRDFFRSETLEHYEEHLPDLAEVLRQAGR